MKSAKPETTFVEYSSLKKEGTKPMATSIEKKIPAEKVTSRASVSKPVAKKATAKKVPTKKVVAKKAIDKKVIVDKPVVEKVSIEKVSIEKGNTDKVSAKKVPAGMTKREVAQGIFDTHFQKKARKDILVMFQNEAKLTKAGSATYYSNMKRKFEETEV